MKLKQKMIYLGLNPKREFGILAIIDFVLLLAAALLYVFLKELLYPGIALGVMLVFDLLFMTRYSKQISEKNSENLRDFATIFGYFRVYIHNGFSVYSALKELVNFANDYLQKSLNTLIKEIDADKSVQPFVKFARQFNEIIIEEMMISIYQMIDDGEQSDYLIQFEMIFDKFSDLLYERYIKSKNSKLGTICSSALVGSCFLIIVLTLGIIGLIGDMINGI